MAYYLGCNPEFLNLLEKHFLGLKMNFVLFSVGVHMEKYAYHFLTRQFQENNQP